jgi:alcohol dehydrogenase class IV
MVVNHRCPGKSCVHESDGPKKGDHMSHTIMNIALSLTGQIGVGSLNNIAKQCKRVSIHKPLIVTDPIMMKIGVAKRAVEILAESGLESALYDRCVENPRVEDVLAGAEKYRDKSCDGIIGLGGGSPIDQGKMIRHVLWPSCSPNGEKGPLREHSSLAAMSTARWVMLIVSARKFS